MEKIGGSPAIYQFALSIEPVCSWKSKLNLADVVALKRAHDLGIGAHRILPQCRSEFSDHCLYVLQVAKHRIWVVLRHCGKRHFLCAR